jgi:hypothetical protein
MNASEAVTEKHRTKGSARQCKFCKHSYFDAEEGRNCLKYDAVITLSSGQTINWPGQACDRAYQTCKGEGFSRTWWAIWAHW